MATLAASNRNVSYVKQLFGWTGDDEQWKKMLEYEQSVHTAMMENSSWCDSDIEWTLLPDSVKKIAISMLKEKVKNNLVNKVTAEKLDQALTYRLQVRRQKIYPSQNQTKGRRESSQSLKRSRKEEEQTTPRETPSRSSRKSQTHSFVAVNSHKPAEEPRVVRDILTPRLSLDPKPTDSGGEIEDDDDDDDMEGLQEDHGPTIVTNGRQSVPNVKRRKTSEPTGTPLNTIPNEIVDRTIAQSPITDQSDLQKQNVRLRIENEDLTRINQDLRKRLEEARFSAIQNQHIQEQIQDAQDEADARSTRLAADILVIEGILKKYK